MPPSVADVVLGSLTVVVGCVGGVAALSSAWRTRNWFGYICALGCAALVAGVIGQQTFPSPATVHRLGSAAAASSVPGPFDAGVTVPLIGIRVTPVALAGLLIAALGLSLLLLFEPVASAAPRIPGQLAPLDEDDSV